MKLLDKILCALDGVLMTLCLIFEFVAKLAPVRMIVVIVAAVYNLSCLVFFAIRDHKKNKNEDNDEQ